jgi:hypothetical protein
MRHQIIRPVSREHYAGQEEAADCAVVSLVPAVFGPQRDTERSEAEYERQGRIRFVKILLEG